MSARRSEGISDVGMLVLIGSVISVCALVWLWGGIAGARVRPRLAAAR